MCISHKIYIKFLIMSNATYLSFKQMFHFFSNSDLIFWSRYNSVSWACQLNIVYKTGLSYFVDLFASQGEVNMIKREATRWRTIKVSHYIGEVDADVMRFNAWGKMPSDKTDTNMKDVRLKDRQIGNN